MHSEASKQQIDFAFSVVLSKSKVQYVHVISE